MPTNPAPTQRWTIHYHDPSTPARQHDIVDGPTIAIEDHVVEVVPLSDYEQALEANKHRADQISRLGGARDKALARASEAEEEQRREKEWRKELAARVERAEATLESVRQRAQSEMTLVTGEVELARAILDLLNPSDQSGER